MVSIHCVYWSLRIGDIPWYLVLTNFPHIDILSNSLSPLITNSVNHDGKSLRFVFGSILYFSESFINIVCPYLESLHGKIALLYDELVSNTFCKSTCSTSPIPLQLGHAHSARLNEKCWDVKSGYCTSLSGQ